MHQPRFGDPISGQPRAKNLPIAVCVFRENGTRFFSSWCVNFSLPTPKRNSLRAAFLEVTNTKILERKPTLSYPRRRNILNVEPVRFATIQADRKKERSTRGFVRTTLPLMDPVTVY